MSIILPRRPIVDLSFLYPRSQCLSLAAPSARRYESTARRTTKRLRTKTDPSFISSVPPSNRDSNIIFNPPSASPSPYQTPPAFLPPDDPRRALLAQSHALANPYHDPTRRMPPPVNKDHQPKKYHLTPDDILEIRRLRQEDPYTWTREVLAKKYECSQFFVGMVAELTGPLGEQRKKDSAAKQELVKERWGRRKRWAREERSRRREAWGRDE